MAPSTMRIAAICLAFTLTALGQDASAQDGGNVDLNAFRPAVDSRGYITVNASQTLRPWEVSIGLVSSWARGVLEFQDGDNTYKVQNLIGSTLVGALGLGVGPLRFQLAASMPFNIMSGDRGPDFDGGTPADPNDDANFKFNGQGTGNLGLHLKLRFLSTSTGPGVGFAVIGSVFLPTGSADDKWLAENKLMPQVLGVLDKEFGTPTRFRLALQGGIRLRNGDEVFVDNSQMGVPVPPATGGVLEAGTSIPFGAAIALALVPEKFEIVAELLGDYATDGENYFPMEAIAGAKVYLAQNSFLTLGGGAGLVNDGGSPDFRLFLGIVFEPNIGDADGDGIKDDVDKCPSDPEDRDGFDDEDGCPDPDNDRDGIPDVDDKCPNDPEDKDGIEDEDGCPESEISDRDGDGIPDDLDKCPDDPEDFDGFEDKDGCPELDNDNDGILDADDLCVNDPEDIDNFEDKDGCPDVDNDKDRIVDADDKCPRVDGESAEETAEVYNGKDDDDGCPDRGRVVVTSTNIEILDKIYFEYNKDTIKRESYPILDAIVATLQGNPDIQLVEIQGHTDERGSDSYNLDLSNRRAASVRRYLIKGGVEEARLQSQGYGESQPLDRRRNEQAWAKNRRVEFVILKRSSD